jgi:hypothetical protein
MLIYMRDGSGPTRLVANIETNGGRDTLRRNVALVCPSCGELWGRLTWIPHVDYNRGPVCWRCEERECTKCGDGTLLTDNELSPHITSELPHDFLAEELRLRLNQEPTTC